MCNFIFIFSNSWWHRPFALKTPAVLSDNDATSVLREFLSILARHPLTGCVIHVDFVVPILCFHLLFPIYI